MNDDFKEFGSDLRNGFTTMLVVIFFLAGLMVVKDNALLGIMSMVVPIILKWFNKPMVFNKWIKILDVQIVKKRWILMVKHSLSGKYMINGFVKIVVILLF